MEQLEVLAGIILKRTFKRRPKNLTPIEIPEQT